MCTLRDIIYNYLRFHAISNRRIIFLETVAGVPGMVAAMTRHLQSLRKMRRDNGWIHTLLGLYINNAPLHLLYRYYLPKYILLFIVSVMEVISVIF